MSEERKPPNTGDKTARVRVQDEVRLAQMASGFAKQYDNFRDALQEVIDNGISASIPNEEYFDHPERYAPIELYLAIIREGDTVWFVVGDNGSGISPDTLVETAFEVSNTTASTGILNNVGWGMKQSLSWFESKVFSAGLETESGDRPAFRLVTRPEGQEQAYKVEGPVTEDMYREPATSEEWEFGVKDEVTKLDGLSHGTRVHLPCSWEQVNKDLWGGERTTLMKRVQALRTELGITFRRVLNAREENHFVLTVIDRDDPDMASMEVHPIDLQFENYVGEERPATFDITADGSTYTVEYERGKLDFEAMVEATREQDDRLLTGGGNLRVGYRASQKYQGIDIYANGRVMMQNVFEDLYRKKSKDDEYISRHDVYNHFGGELRIVPKNEADSVPTDNKKTAVDTSHELWEQIEMELRDRGGPVNTYERDKGGYRGDAEGTSSKTQETDFSREQDDGVLETEDGGDEIDSQMSPGTDVDSSPTSSEEGNTAPTTDGATSTDTTDGVDGGGGDDLCVKTMDDSEFERRFRDGKFDHDDLVKRLKAKLEAESTTQRVATEKHYKGTRVDVDQVLEDGSHILWEVRPTQQDRRAVYHISMYQDVFKATGSDSFHRSVLLSDGLSTDAEDLLHGDDQRRDICGDPYELEQQDILDKLA